MHTTALLRLHHAFRAAIATFALAACADHTPLSPGVDAERASPVAHLAAGPDLGTCDNLRPPAGTQFGFHTYARGVQIYRWNGSAWAFVGPRADLFADAGGKGKIGTHYAGPFWESSSGSKVKGALIERCVSSDADAIDWLALAADSENETGVFRRVVFIQRVNTVGGKAPATAGSMNEVREVPYTAQYYFYRAR